MTDRASLGAKQVMLASLPMYAYHTRKALHSLRYEILMIEPKDLSDQEDLYLSIKQKIPNANSSYSSQSNEDTLA